MLWHAWDLLDLVEAATAHMRSPLHPAHLHTRAHADLDLSVPVLRIHWKLLEASGLKNPCTRRSCVPRMEVARANTSKADNCADATLYLRRQHHAKDLPPELTTREGAFCLSQLTNAERGEELGP